MNNNRFLKVLCLGVFIVHMVIVNAGVFSPAINRIFGSAGTGGSICIVAYQGFTDSSVSEGSGEVFCAECKWVTWELGTDGKYTKVEHSDEITYYRQICKKGKKGDSCMSSTKVGASCPESDPEPPDTGTGTDTGTN